MSSGCHRWRARRAIALAVGALALAFVQQAQAAAPCNPALAPSPLYLSEGPTSAIDAAINVPSRGTVRAKVVFVDFPDAPGTADPATLAADLAIGGPKWLRTTSYGAFDLQLSAHPQWLRMPNASTAYGFPGVSYDVHKRYIADAFAAADPVVDFSQTDLVYIMAPPSAAIPQSPTFRGLPGAFVLDGRDMGRVVTFGQDSYKFRVPIVVHETGHLLGLPDVYAHSGDAHRFVGTWDLMGNVFLPTDLFAWHRLKLGWLTPGQFSCVGANATTTITLTPLGRPSGKKAIFIRTGPYTALVAENRQKVANDIRICDTGLLVYRVDSRVATGRGPIAVIGGTHGNGCGYGPRSDAPLHVGQRLTVGRTTFTVTRKVGLNITVRITRS